MEDSIPPVQDDDNHSQSNEPPSEEASLQEDPEEKGLTKEGEIDYEDLENFLQEAEDKDVRLFLKTVFP